jgi:hypothetical protein
MVIEDGIRATIQGGSLDNAWREILAAGGDRLHLSTRLNKCLGVEGDSLSERYPTAS